MEALKSRLPWKTSFNRNAMGERAGNASKGQRYCVINDFMPEIEVMVNGSFPL